MQDLATEIILTLGQAFEVAYQLALRDSTPTTPMKSPLNQINDRLSIRKSSLSGTTGASATTTTSVTTTPPNSAATTDSSADMRNHKNISVSQTANSILF